MADTQKIELLNGYMGKILKVDLTSLQFQTEPLDFHMTELFFGGRGLGVALLFRHFLGLQQRGGTTLEQAAHNASSAEGVGQFRTEAFINEKLSKGPKVNLFEPK